MFRIHIGKTETNLTDAHLTELAKNTDVLFSFFLFQKIVNEDSGKGKYVKVQHSFQAQFFCFLYKPITNCRILFLW